ncbi:MAG: MATE family efflux transporter [Lachnospiraceae bacterium]|nr:MATE family efflux transporter [Lachnospiraceae bacterium]
MNSKSTHEIDMLNGSILPKILLFALPLALSGVLQLLFNAADVIVLGRYVGSDALAAVSSTGSLTGLLTNLFIGISVGVNVVVATNYASGKYNEVSKVVHTSIAVALVSGFFLIALGWLFAEPMLKLMGSPENVLPLSVRYLKIYFAGMPFIMLYNFGSAVLRSIGDTKRPLYYLFIAGVVNVCLNLFFVIKLNMGVAGVAIATVASHCVSSLLILRALIKEDSCLKLNPRKLNLDIKTIKKFAQVGIPAGLQSVLFAVSNVLIQSSVNSFGSIVMAGNGASASLEGFQYTAMHSVYTAAITFIGQNVGAKKYSRLNKIAFSSLACVTIVGFVFQGIFAVFGRNLLWLYTTDPEVVTAALVRLTIFMLSYWTCGLMDVSSGLMRGMGYGTLPTVVSLIGAVGLRIVWLYTVFAAVHDYRILLIGYPISWTLTFAAHLICYFKAKAKLPKEDGVAMYY